jgi:hypothetical protein
MLQTDERQPATDRLLYLRIHQQRSSPVSGITYVCPSLIFLELKLREVSLFPLVVHVSNKT